jgi:hypothetical protein
MTPPANELHLHQCAYLSHNSQVFAGGSMQWNWGLDDYGITGWNLTPRLTNSVARQMTDNIPGNFQENQQCRFRKFVL